MRDLDISRINETAPYKVFVTRRNHYYGFITRAGVVLSVGFDEDDLISTESYQLVLLNGNNKPSPRDVAVRDTIFAIVSEFFRANNATMLYICEDGDGRQAMRSRLFSHWFSAFVGNGVYTMLQSSIVDRDGASNFFAIITRNDNPNFNEVMAEFTSTVRFFTHKPKE